MIKTVCDLPFELLLKVAQHLSFSDLWYFSTSSKQAKIIGYELILNKYDINLIRPKIVNPFAQLTHSAVAYLDRHSEHPSTIQSVANHMTVAINDRIPTDSGMNATLEFLLDKCLSILIESIFLDIPYLSKLELKQWDKLRIIFPTLQYDTNQQNGIDNNNNNNNHIHNNHNHNHNNNNSNTNNNTNNNNHNNHNHNNNVGNDNDNDNDNSNNNNDSNSDDNSNNNEDNNDNNNDSNRNENNNESNHNNSNTNNNNNISINNTNIEVTALLSNTQQQEASSTSSSPLKDTTSINNTTTNAVFRMTEYIISLNEMLSVFYTDSPLKKLLMPQILRVLNELTNRRKRENQQDIAKYGLRICVLFIYCLFQHDLIAGIDIVSFARELPQFFTTHPIKNQSPEQNNSNENKHIAFKNYINYNIHLSQGQTLSTWCYDAELRMFVLMDLVRIIINRYRASGQLESLEIKFLISMIQNSLTAFKSIKVVNR